MVTIVDALGQPEPEVERGRCAFCNRRGAVVKLEVGPYPLVSGGWLLDAVELASDR